MNNKAPNRLINENSPYLLQHAYNPVDWYPWGEEAFEKAKRENKLIFLSIGYSTCHWCHVMEKESFEDENTARLINKNFVPIKVDREQRPDVDAVYMKVCLALTGSGGWPLTVILLPDKRPVYAGTYFPPQSRYGMPGLPEVLTAISEQWKKNGEKLIGTAKNITELISVEETAEGKVSKELITKAFSQLEATFDSKYGGFGTRPKFPTPHNIMFLLRYYYFTKDKNALRMAEKTLTNMYLGGIFDHIGYGFSRYSTDQMWMVPHFEKMLYDNALLAIAYLEAYTATGNQLFKEVAEKILLYVRREMTDDKGGFYSAQDADSEKGEGGYYVFTPAEIEEVLGSEDAKVFCEYFEITEKGNFEGKNIPNLLGNMDFEKNLEQIKALVDKVYRYRAGRMELKKDDKILTSWNALMIAALATAYRITRNGEYRQAAEKAVNFIKKHMCENGRLKVAYRDGKTSGDGFLDDYAFFAWALLELYQSTFDAEYVKLATDTVKTTVREFEDKNSGLFLYPEGGERLIIRPKEVYDGAMPSGNSAAAYVLTRLSKLTGDIELIKMAQKQLEFVAGAMQQYPAGYCFGAMALMLALFSTKEIVLVTEDDAEKEKFKSILSKTFAPGVSAIIKDAANKEVVDGICPFTKNMTDRGAAAYYICRGNSCGAPRLEITEADFIG